ncbi:MAG: LysM peptidoglycan-binding domain-containing protein [Caldilineaceae bacterium]|nr:LysM peptidoglycan-binding domain-containing protein [Caldilineaceae bacterium]
MSSYNSPTVETNKAFLGILALMLALMSLFINAGSADAMSGFPLNGMRLDTDVEYSQTLDCSAYHVVSRGETLSSIARSAGVSIRSIMQCNGLASYMVYAGQGLRIPQAVSSTPAATPQTRIDRSGYTYTPPTYSYSYPYTYNQPQTYDNNPYYTPPR